MSFPRYTRLSLAMAAAALLPCTQALAAPVITVAANSAATFDGNTGTTTSFSNPPSYAGSSTQGSNANGSGAGSGWASSSGAYAVAAVAGGKGTASGSAQFKYLLVNETGLAQNYTMSFHIYGGSIGTYFNQPLASNEAVGAGYSASIKVGGSEKFASSAAISLSSTGVSFAKAGTSLSNDTTADGVYSWGAGDFAIDVGVLAPGASVEIIADVSDSAFANVGVYTGTSNCNPYPYPTVQTRGDASTNVVGVEQCVVYKAGANAFYGDPADIGATPISPFPAVFNAVAVTVPEPATLALTGLALGGLALTRRRRPQAA